MIDSGRLFLSAALHDPGLTAILSCKMTAERDELGKCALRRGEPQLHQSSGRIVDEDQQGVRQPAILKLTMLAAIDLSHLAKMLVLRPGG
jgi:hypothetical protein